MKCLFSVAMLFAGYLCASGVVVEFVRYDAAPLHERREMIQQVLIELKKEREAKTKNELHNSQWFTFIDR